MRGRWRTEEITADRGSNGEIDLVSVFEISVWDMDEADDSAGKIIRYETSPNFLLDKKRFGSMKSGKTDGIFEITKRRFNSPTTII